MARKKVWRIESEFQAFVIKTIENNLEGSFVLKNDCNYIQGIPDLSVYYGNKYAILECKRSINEPFRPNQENYLEYFNNIGFARMICPENMEDVLEEMTEYFGGKNEQ